MSVVPSCHTAKCLLVFLLCTPSIYIDERLSCTTQDMVYVHYNTHILVYPLKRVDPCTRKMGPEKTQRRNFWLKFPNGSSL